MYDNNGVMRVKTYHFKFTDGNGAGGGMIRAKNEQDAYAMAVKQSPAGAHITVWGEEDGGE
jgi:hypothetical protein